MAEHVLEYALQVVPVGTLDPQQLVTGLRAPPGYVGSAVQILPVVLHSKPTLGELHAPRAVSAICFVWSRAVPAFSQPPKSDDAAR